MLPKTLNILRKFGRSKLTGQDFVALCEANSITVKITSLCSRGMYYCVGGKHYIVLSSKADAATRRFIGWHEFAHFLENFNERRTITAFSNVEPEARTEILADVFAKIAIDPAEHRLTGPIDFIKMIMRGSRTAQRRRSKE